MFKQVARSTTRQLINHRQSPSTFSALSRFQTANAHDFTIKCSFPLSAQGVESFKSDVKSKAQGKEVTQYNFETTYFDCVPKQFILPSSSSSSSLSVQTEKFELYTLSKRDTWLRLSNGAWVCQSPFKDTKGDTHLRLPVHERVAHYEEQHGEKEIRRELNLQQDVTREAREKIKLPSLTDDLAVRMGVVPYATFKYTQTVYNMPENFVLDVYSTDFGYSIAIMSSVVKNGTEIDLNNRSATMISTLGKLGIDMDKQPQTKSLILEWIARNNPDHYRALVDANIAPPQQE